MKLFGRSSRRRRQELYCHNCDMYVQFVIDLEQDGNHVLHCPKCKHEHCRVVKDGEITDIRWDQRNGPTIIVCGGTTSSAPVFYTALTTTSNTMYFLTGGGGSGGGGS